MTKTKAERKDHQWFSMNHESICAQVFKFIAIDRVARLKVGSSIFFAIVVLILHVFA